jgi:hypothetical protein
MSLLNQQNNKGKKKANKKNNMGDAQGSKFINKPGKAAGIAQKPHKAGGTRGS